jgi:hypothetical protein
MSHAALIGCSKNILNRLLATTDHQYLFLPNKLTASKSLQEAGRN